MSKQSRVPVTDPFHIIEFGKLVALTSVAGELKEQYKDHRLAGLPLGIAAIEKAVAESKLELFRMNTLAITDAGVDISVVASASLQAHGDQLYIQWSSEDDAGGKL